MADARLISVMNSEFTKVRQEGAAQSDMLTALAEQQAEVKAEVGAISLKVTDCMNAIKAIMARVEGMDVNASKRPLKKANVVAPKEVKVGETSNVSNSMLYMKHMWATDDAFRAKFMEGEKADEIQSAFDADTMLAKKTDVAKLRAEAQIVWKLLNSSEKAAIAEEFKEWKKKSEE